MEPLKVVNDISIVLSFADFRDPEKLNEFALRQEIWTLAGQSINPW